MLIEDVDVAAGFKPALPTKSEQFTPHLRESQVAGRFADWVAQRGREEDGEPREYDRREHYVAEAPGDGLTDSPFGIPLPTALGVHAPAPHRRRLRTVTPTAKAVLSSQCDGSRCRAQPVPWDPSPLWRSLTTGSKKAEPRAGQEHPAEQGPVGRARPHPADPEERHGYERIA